MGIFDKLFRKNTKQIDNDFEDMFEKGDLIKLDTVQKVVEHSNSGSIGQLSLSNVNLSDTNFKGMTLNNISIRNSNLKGIDFSTSILNNVDFSGSDFTGAKLTMAKLKNSKLINTNFTKAALSIANLSGSDLTGANLTDSSLFGTDLRNANLTNANLTNANMTESFLIGTNLTNANMKGANLTKAVYNEPVLTLEETLIKQALRDMLNKGQSQNVHSNAPFFILNESEFRQLINLKTKFKIWEQQITEKVEGPFSIARSSLRPTHFTGKYHFLIQSDVTEKIVGVSQNTTNVFNVPWELVREENFNGKKYIIFSGWGDPMNGGYSQFEEHEIGIESSIMLSLINHLINDNPDYFSRAKMRKVIGLESFNL